MKKTVFETFAAPFLLLAVTLAGLIIGVVANGLWDAVAAVALAAPLAAIAASLFWPRRRAIGGRPAPEPLGVREASAPD